MHSREENCVADLNGHLHVFPDDDNQLVTATVYAV